MISGGVSGAWNFVPSLDVKKTVGELSSQVAAHYGLTGEVWKLESDLQPHEAGYLLLDSSKARLALDWSDHLNFEDSIQWTVEWYLNKGLNHGEITKSQIQQFFEKTRNHHDK